MEKQKLEEFFKNARTLSLTDKERAAMRQRVVLHMRRYSARNSADIRFLEWMGTLLHKPIPLKFKYTMPILLILALLASGGGVSYAAQGSLPGDPLYAVKVDINEPIAGLFQVSPQAKAEWNAFLAQTRLQEAERLAAENKLNPQLQAQVTQRMETAVAAAQSDVMRLVQQNKIAVAAQINNELETTLRVHAEVLTRLADRNQSGGGGDANENDAQNVVSATTRQAQRVAGVSDQINASTTEQVRANGPRAQSAVMNKGDEARSFVDDVAGLLKDQGASLDATTSAQVQASLTLAQQKMAAGDAASQAGNYAEAFGDYQAAQQSAQDAKVRIVATHTYRVEFEGEGAGSSSEAGGHGNAPQEQGVNRNQEQNTNASSSDKNRETEQNQHENQNQFIPQIENDIQVPLPVNQNASATTNLRLQLNASGTTINVGGEVGGGEGQQNGRGN